MGQKRRKGRFHMFCSAVAPIWMMVIGAALGWLVMDRAKRRIKAMWKARPRRVLTHTLAFSVEKVFDDSLLVRHEGGRYALFRLKAKDGMYQPKHEFTIEDARYGLAMDDGALVCLRFWDTPGAWAPVLTWPSQAFDEVNKFGGADAFMTRFYGPNPGEMLCNPSVTAFPPADGASQ